MALPLNRDTWQTDFSSLNRRVVFVRDNNGRYFVVDTATKRRFETGGPGSGSYNAASRLYGAAIRGVYLTGYRQYSASSWYNQRVGVNRNAMEMVAAGLARDPITGQYVENPTRIRAGNGQWYNPPSRETGTQRPPGTPPTEPSQPAAPTVPEPPRRDFAREAKALVGWLPTELLNIWTREYTNNQGADDPASLAWAEVRTTSAYEKYFPGNRRTDGSLRLPEQEYLAWVEGYKTELQRYGVNPKAFGKKFATLIEGGVDPGTFRSRIAQVYVNVINNIDEVRAAYAEEFGITNSLAAIVASAIDPDLTPAEYDARFRKAAVMGEGRRAGLNLDFTQAEVLSTFGFEQQAARELFTQMQQLAPSLGELAKRHFDPDDDFDFEELSDALVVGSPFGDPEQRARVSRLFAQERSQFSPFSLFSFTAEGGIAGLREQ